MHFRAQIPKDQQEKFLTSLEQEEFSPGDYIVKEGDMGDKVQATLRRIALSILSSPFWQCFVALVLANCSFMLLLKERLSSRKTM